MLAPVYTLNQTGSSNTLLLNDITGSYSSGAPNGWGFPNLPVGAVTSITMSGTYRPAPSFAAPVVIPSIELMPTTANPLPYVLGQQFELNPSQFGFTTPTFPDGIYQMQININQSPTYTLYISSTTLPWRVGDTITNTTTSEILGTVYSITYPSINNSTLVVLLPSTGNTVTTGQDMTNGTSGGWVLASGTPAPAFSSLIYTANPQLYLTVNADCAIANGMSKYCNCGCPDNVELNTAFMQLLSSKEMAGCFQYNSCLDTLYCFQKWANSSGCNCN